MIRVLHWVKQASHRTDVCAWLYLHDIFKIVKVKDTESRMVVARGWGKGRGEQG